jgi:hypothetical protein
MINDCAENCGIKIGKGNGYNERIHSSRNLSTTNPTWNIIQAAVMGKLANNDLSYGTA